MLVGLRLGLCARDRNADCEAVVNLKPLLKSLNGADQSAIDIFCVEFFAGTALPDIEALFNSKTLCEITGFIAGTLYRGGHPEIIDNPDVVIKHAALSFMAGAAFQKRIEELRQLERMSK